MDVIEKLQETSNYIRSQCQIKPKISIVLGSGLGAFVKKVNVACSIPYSDLPHFEATTVEGHKGRLVLGHVEKTPVAILQGRVHYYEGYSMESVVYPVRTLAMLGTEANYVLDYQRDNPHFPHQTTADQFFDEAQFEAYRKLGELAANNFFIPPFVALEEEKIAKGAGFKEWFTELVQHMLKDTDPVFV